MLHATADHSRFLNNLLGFRGIRTFGFECLVNFINATLILRIERTLIPTFDFQHMLTCYGRL
jgi:hypothetical protein